MPNEASRSRSTAGRIVKDLMVAISFAAILAAMLVTVADIGLRLAADIVDIATEVRPRWRVNGVVDLMQLATIIAVSLAIAVNFLSNSHIRIDLLISRLGPLPLRLARGLAALAGSMVMGICLWTAWAALQSQLDFPSTSASLGLSLTWYNLPLIVGLAIGLLCSLWLLLREILTGFGYQTGDDV